MSEPGAKIEMPVVAEAPFSAAAHAFQVAIEQQSTTPTSTASPAAHPDMAKDVVMSDFIPDRHASPAVASGTTIAPPLRTGTPSQLANGNNTSRAASAHPEPSSMPSHAPPHGAPTRQYLNGKVTGVLLEGMKQLAKEQPKDPLRMLGEYLLQRSKELEGTS